MKKHASALLLSFALLGAATPVAAQSTGRIIGRVVAEESREPLPGAQVAIVGTERGALTDADGRFTIDRVPAGTHAVAALYLGRAERRVEGVVVTTGGAAQADIALPSAAIEIEALTVSARRETGSVATALSEQRSAIGVTSATTAEQISRSPDSDAAEAVRRVSGVTVQDGRYVFVRGLGERYTTTSLNGSRVPSPEPERKVVPLDLFPTSLLASITTSKTFTPDQPGDFSGAAVDMRTRAFPSERLLQLSVSGGFNTQSTGRDMPMPASLGGEWAATAAAGRELPGQLTGTADFASLSRTELNSLIRALPRSWLADDGGGMPNGSASLSVGGQDPILGLPLGYVGSLSYSRSQELRSDEVRARAVPGDAEGTPIPYNEFNGSTGTSSVLWGGMLNLSTRIGATTLELNNTYNRTSDNQAHVDWGTLEEFAQVDTVRRSSLRYVERTVRSSQLRASHTLFGDDRVDASLTASAVSRIEPDRADLAYGRELAPTGERLPLAWLGFIPGAARRTASDLHEDAVAADFSYALVFGAALRPTTLRFGGAWRSVERDANSTSYNLRAAGLGPEQRAATPDELFYGAYTDGDASGIVLEPNSAGGFYRAEDDVAAGFAMAELPLGGKLKVIAGARVERWNLGMDVEPTTGGVLRIERTNTDVLPSIALSADLGRHTLRGSATRTLARPEYRELAPISYRDMLGEREVFGDSSLVRTRVENYDARWEFYPAPAELFSVGVFVKRFHDPIEPIDVATTGTSQLSFINAESALNYGIELELRHGLGFVNDALSGFGGFANVTLMRSRINTSNSTMSALTNDERPMAGQAPYVVNTGITYASTSGTTSATLLYNVVGERISSAAVMPLTVDTYEQPRHQLDFSVRFPMGAGMSARFDAKNLLDAAFEERQGSVVRHRYTTGRTFGFGLTWAL